MPGAWLALTYRSGSPATKPQALTNMAPLSGQLTRSLKSGDQRQLLARRRGPAPAVPPAAIRTMGVRKLGPQRRTEIKSSLVAQRLPKFPLQFLMLRPDHAPLVQR